LTRSTIDVIENQSRQAFLRPAAGFKVVIDRAGHKKSNVKGATSTEEIEQF
jgi:hypothetical protein